MERAQYLEQLVKGVQGILESPQVNMYMYMYCYQPGQHMNTPIEVWS